MKKLLATLALLLLPFTAEAACSGSGSTRTCAAGSTEAQIRSAISAVGGGGTVIFEAGTYTDSVSLSSVLPTGGVSLVCETIATGTTRDCTFNTSGNAFLLDFVPSDITGLLRIAGFNFNGGGSYKIWLYGENDIDQLRIDHNTFNEVDAGGFAIYLGENTAEGYIAGVIDNNAFISNTAGNSAIVEGDYGGAGWRSNLPGSVNNVHIEDNTITMAGGSYDPGRGCIDLKKGSSFVVRFNTFDGCRILSHGVFHGGPPAWEAYGNQLESPDGYRLIHHQGSGEWLVFGNRLIGSGHIELQHYRSSSDPNGAGAAESCDGDNATGWNDGNRTPLASYRGYPCGGQPGRAGTGVEAPLKPNYFWDNLEDGTTNAPPDISGYGDNQYLSLHMVANRDYYFAGSASAQSNATTPFNGTSGVGFGTIGNRPTTCTPTPLAADAGEGGVGYAATNGSWKTATPTYGYTSMPAYVLYRCSATDTWTLEYTPYTYPHPLRDEGEVDSSWTRVVIFLSGFAMLSIALGAIYGQVLAGVARSFTTSNFTRGTGRNTRLGSKVEG